VLLVSLVHEVIVPSERRRMLRSYDLEMPEPLSCYRCGTSLARLTLPLARLDECPSCAVHLHVCRMCLHYAPSRPKQCTEDDALEVRDKRSANFCDYFAPSARAFAGAEMAAEQQAREQLAALFGQAAEQRADAGTRPNVEKAADVETPPEVETPGLSAEELARRQAEALFKK
jgi:hypothetical protein